MIDVENLVYDYPSGRALHGLGFVVRPGAVLALVGPNGAGKSTLMRCIAALDAPTEGEITVQGLDTRRNAREIHAALGYLPDTFGLYDALSVRRSLIYAARSRGVDAAQADSAATEAAARVGLSDRMDALAGTLSRGLRQRLAIAQTIVHQPRVLLLDEPASGLDPEARRDLSALIRGLANEAQGVAAMTIVVSSHILAELEDYCTEMLMLDKGRVVGDGVVRAGAPLWGETLGGETLGGETLGGETLGGEAAAVRLEPEGEAAATADPSPSRVLSPVRVDVTFSTPVDMLEERLAALGFLVTRADAAHARIALSPGAQAEQEALARLVGAGLPVSGFSPVRATLEQTYLAAAAARNATAVPETGAEIGR